jgi:hypothetical protein
MYIVKCICEYKYVWNDHLEHNGQIGNRYDHIGDLKSNGFTSFQNVGEEGSGLISISAKFDALGIWKKLMIRAAIASQTQW